VYTGDTRPTRAVREISSGVDLLIHEATFGEDEEALARISGHSTTGQAACLAREAGVRHLVVLTHFSPRYAACPHVLEAQAIRIFPRTRAVASHGCRRREEVEVLPESPPDRAGDPQLPSKQNHLGQLSRGTRAVKHVRGPCCGSAHSYASRWTSRFPPTASRWRRWRSRSSNWLAVAAAKGGERRRGERGRSTAAGTCGGGLLRRGYAARSGAAGARSCAITWPLVPLLRQ
jgi:hypothetical protein